MRCGTLVRGVCGDWSGNMWANGSACGYVQSALDTRQSVKPNGTVQSDDPGGLAVYGAGLPLFDCWYRWFESRRRHVSCACCVGSGLCEVLITRPEESCRLCVYVYLCVTYKHQQGDGLDPISAFAQ
jgi:hypothetical protein